MGVEVTRAYGKEHRDNLVDDLLSFNVAQTWSNTSGTGTASLDNNILFEGVSSLKIINTAPTTDLVVSNTTQSTIIPFDGNYGVSFKMRKDEVDEFMTLELITFQNASPLTAQTFVLGSETTADDLLVNDLWIPYTINTQYPFTKGDDITFTFTLKGKAGTILPTTTVWIDGMQLESLETQNAMPSTYTKPTPSGLVESFGVYDYGDLTTTGTPIQLTLADTQYELTNDGAGANSNLTYKFTDVANFWNTGTNRFDFTGLVLGDTVDFRIDVEYTTGTVDTDIFLVLELGIGGTSYQLNLISNASKKSAGTYQEVRWYSVYMGDSNTLDNPARFLASADKTGTTVKVNGWYIRPMKRLV